MFLLRTSPLVLSMWASKREFNEEKSKHCLMCQQNSFGPTFVPQDAKFFFGAKFRQIST
jgi:hypothetical protein